MNSRVTALLLAGCWACCLLDSSAMRLPDALPSPPRNPIGASYSFSVSHTGDTRTSVAATRSSGRRFSAADIKTTTAQPSVRRFSAPRWNPVANERRTPATTSPRLQTTAAPETPVNETPEYDVQILDDPHADVTTPEVPVQDLTADDPPRVLVPELSPSDATAPDTPVPDVLIPDEEVPEVPVTKAEVSKFPYYEYYDEQDNEPQNAVPSAPVVHQDNEKSTRDQNLVQPADTPSSESLSPALYRRAEYVFKTVYVGR